MSVYCVLTHPFPRKYSKYPGIYTSGDSKGARVAPGNVRRATIRRWQIACDHIARPTCQPIATQPHSCPAPSCGRAHPPSSAFTSDVTSARKKLRTFPDNETYSSRAQGTAKPRTRRNWTARANGRAESSLSRVLSLKKKKRALRWFVSIVISNIPRERRRR